MKKPTFYILTFFVAAVSCTEPYPLDNEANLEELLVVEATITNQLKKQEIKVSRVYELGTEEYAPETDAEVYVQDDAGNIYDFEFNQEEGFFTSVMPFQAMPERTYKLFVNSEGTEYESTPQVLPTQSELENIVVVPKTVDGVEGLEIQANSFDPSGNSKYYRYEYEETYKVIAEYWSQYKVLVLSPASLDYMETDEYKKICYATKSSATALLKSTQDLVEDRVQDFPVKFIPKTDGTISHRYSILVTQYVMNLEAFNFHQTHHNIYGGGTTLSPVQPGFIRGNISAIGSDKKVVGLFDVASESSKRIFFSYADFYSGELPDPFECEIEILNSADFNFTPPPADGMTIINYTENNKMLLYDVVGDEYYMVPLECGDCSTVGSPVVPEFWEE